MSDKRILTTCYSFQNGMVMAFDQHGQQMPNYQGQLDEVADKIRRDFPKVRILGVRWKSRSS